MYSDASPRGWLWANPGQLERFADDVDELVGILELLRSRQVDAASFRSPSTDPATVRAATQLAEDGHDRPGTPVHAVTTIIEDLRQQVAAARLAARDHRARELAIVEDLRRAEEQTP